METTEALPQEGGCRPLLVMIPYTEGVSDDIRWVCRKFGMKVVFRSGQSLRSMLTKVKDALSMEKMSKVVYQVPCSCGKAYISYHIVSYHIIVQVHHVQLHTRANCPMQHYTMNQTKQAE